MNRRDFLRTLAAGLAGTTVADTFDWDRLLWVPVAKRIFLPPEPSNSLLTIDYITRETLRMLENNLQLSNLIATRYLETEAALGDRYTVRVI